MDKSTDDVRRDRERTRSAITEKIELIEERVRDSVEGAKTKVKQSLDIRHHVDQRPWQMLGVSILTGYLVGRLMSDRASDVRAREYAPKHRRPQQVLSAGFDETAATMTSTEEGVYPPSRARLEQKSSWGILDQFQDELAILKGAGIAAVVSVVRDLIKSATSSVKDSAKSITNKRRSSTEVGGQTGLH